MVDLVQTLVWTALPVGRNGERFRAAVFVSPRLQYAEQDNRALGDFPDLLEWTGNVFKDLSFSILFSSGATVNAEPDRTLLDPELWQHLFSETTPVFPYKFPAGRARVIASYPVMETLTFIRDTYRAVGREIVVDPGHRLPIVLGSPGYLALKDTLGDVTSDGFAESVPRLDGKERFAYNPAGECYMGRKGTSSGNHIPPDKMAFYQAFRFFKPPQLAGYMQQWMVNHREEPWNKKNDGKDWKRKPVPVPEFDFHRILAALADHPAIMQKLGLVIFFDILIPKNAGNDSWFRVLPKWRNPLSLTTIDLCPRTWYTILSDRFLAKSRSSGQQALLQKGWLNLKETGDISPSGFSGSPFGISQVDSDGATLKVLHFATTLALYPFLKLPNLTDALPPKVEKSLPAAQGLPALRSAGISLFRNSRAWQMATVLNPSDPESVAVKNTLLESSTPGSAHVLDLYAEDLLRGYRVDVEDGALPHHWRSLCWRSGIYHVTDVRDGTTAEQIEIDEQETDEGYVKSASAASYDDLTLYVHEFLFQWNGWSLCVRRPGKTILEDGRPGDMTNDAVEHIGLRGEFYVPAGSLPALRFGHEYRLRVRAVDIAGNDMTGDLRKWNSQEETWASNPVRYYRFDPLAPPSLIPRRPVKEGESLELLVIRSDTDLSAAEYATTLNNFSAGYFETCERHFIPPKTSELMAERHGMFDPWIGKDLSAADYQEGFKIAARESWSPTLEEDPNNPKNAYLDEDNCVVQFLPDPLADAVFFVGLPGAPVNPATGESEYMVPFVSRVGGWPDNRVPFRLVLHEIPLDAHGLEKAPVWNDDGASRDLHIFLAKGCVRKVRYCTIYGKTGPAGTGGGHPSALMGVAEWMKHGADILMAENIDAVIKSGRHWMVSPYRELTLVHAVQHPLAEPIIRPASCPNLPLMANKEAIGDTGAKFCANFCIDAKSTGKLELLAQWSEPVDNPADPAPADRLSTGHAFTVTVDDPASDTILITGDRYTHEFGDTKHRFVNYRLRATSRFREFFPQNLWEKLSIDGGEYKKVNVLNSARPSAPRIVSILPLFGWGEEEAIAITKPQKMLGRGHKIEGKRRTRHGGGLRVYLERPWFSSGEGELLGVVVWQDGNASGSINTRDVVTMQNVTQWGRDPIYDADSGDPADLSPGLNCFLNAEVKDRDRSLAELGQPPVSVAGFPVRFDADRRLWYADIHMDIGTAYFPFVRFGLARYQPDSITGAHLSNIVLAQFAQLAPGRTASVTYDPDDVEGLNVRVEVRGIAQGPELVITAGPPIGGIKSPNIVVVTVERATLGIADPDLRWAPVIGKNFPLKADYDGPYSVVWSGDLTLPAQRGTEPFRLMIREYETFTGEQVEEEYPEEFTLTKTNMRLVYAEYFII